MRGETKQTAFFSGQQKLATVEAVDAFVRTADRGAEFVYCEAREPMRGETWARVGELVQAELARQVGLSTRILAQNRVRRLIEVGLIESTVAHEGGVPRRVVTIVETGRRTKLPPKWAALEAAARNDSQAAGNAVPRTNPAAPPAR
jgi:hypothetical protein